MISPHLKPQVNLVLGFLVWLSLILGLTYSPWLMIKAIDCQLTDGQPCPTNLVQNIQSLVGNKLFFSDFATRLNNNPDVSLTFKLENIKIHFPSKLELTFKPVTLSYILVDQQIKYIVTQTGSVVGNQNAPENLPLITISAKDSIYAFQNTNKENIEPILHANIDNTLQALKTIDIIPLKINYISEYRLEIELSSGLKIIFDSTQAQQNARRLKAIFTSKKLNEELDKNSVVDLRFLLPVLRKSE